jgi:hypothetical protein
MARQQSCQRPHPRPVPVEHLSARQSSRPGDVDCSTRDTDADTRETRARAINHDFVKLNQNAKRTPAMGAAF